MDVKKYITENYPDHTIIIPDGFDDAFMGIGFSMFNAFACYNLSKVIEILMNDGMTYDEAVEYFEFNIAGAYIGENNPIFIEVPEKDIVVL
jgi:hypothetical protein